MHIQYSPFRRLGMADVMRIYGLTARALRLYEEKGLIEAHRDRLNCRYYDSVTAARIECIAQLRSAGLGLGDIKEVLKADDEGTAAQVASVKLAGHRRELIKELGRLDGIAARLNGGLAASNDSAPTSSRQGERV